MPNELWTEVHDIVQETGIKTISMEKKCKRAKWLSEEALQIAVKRRQVKSKGEKERYTHLNGEFHRITRRDKIYYHVRIESPVCVRCWIQHSWGWCTGMTQRDVVGREVEEGFMFGIACTPMLDSCQCMAKPIQYCKVM